MKKRQLFLFALAFALILFGKLEDANAYFTTYVTAKGGYDVNFGHEEKIEEEFVDWNKYVKISSKEGSIPVYVRVKAFAGSTYRLEFSGNDWFYSEKDGFYYYRNALEGGQTTSALCIGIRQIPVNPEVKDNFNVVVVYETMPIQYDENGNMADPAFLDWSKILGGNQVTYPVEMSQNDSITMEVTEDEAQ